MVSMQKMLFKMPRTAVAPLRMQLLKWVGNKQRFAHEIVSHFPPDFRRYYEPFIGSGAVLATLAPSDAVASDAFSPLIQIWRTLHDDPECLKTWYAKRWRTVMAGDKIREYERIKTAYNQSPNGADLLFLCRSCYGGVVRFRQADGFMSTPCGVHRPITPEAFARRVDAWHQRTKGTEFR
jgi:DNA adenine methylase